MRKTCSSLLVAQFCGLALVHPSIDTGVNRASQSDVRMLQEVQQQSLVAQLLYILHDNMFGMNMKSKGQERFV